MVVMGRVLVFLCPSQIPECWNIAAWWHHIVTAQCCRQQFWAGKSALGAGGMENRGSTLASTLWWDSGLGLDQQGMGGMLKAARLRSCCATNGNVQELGFI